MRSLALYAGVALVVSSCSCGKPTKLGGLIADVHRAAGVRASCVELKVTGGMGEALDTKSFAFESKSQLQIGIGSDGWPRDLTLTATPLWSADGCTGAQPNGPAVEKKLQFPASGVETVRIDLELPPMSLDGDGDRFVKALDCDDANVAAFPGAMEDCLALTDLDCDSLAGCADPQCAMVMGCAQPADRLAFVTPARSPIAGACSEVLEVESRSAGGPRPLAPGAIVFLAAMPAGARFFSDAACTAEVTSRVATAGQSRFTFYFSSMTPGTFDATATSVGLTAATQAQTVRPPAAARLAIVTPARTVQAGACSQALDVESQSAAGAPSPVMSDTRVDLTVLPGGAVTFYSNSTCTAQVASLTLGAGATRTTFYVRGVTAGVPMVTASAAGFAAASQAVTVTAGAPAKLEFTTPAQGVARDACSTAVSVRAEDALGNPVALAGATQVDLTVAMGVPVTFFPMPGCMGATVAFVTLPAAAGSVATFYFKGGMTIGTSTIRASTASGTLMAATQDETVGAGPPHHLAFTTPLRPITAGGCSGLVTVQVQDDMSFGTNPATPIPVTLAGMPAMGFGLFSDATCTTALATPLMLTGTPSASFYFSANQTPSVTVTATTTAMGVAAAAPQVHPVGAAGPAALVITTPAQTLVAGDCSAAARVEVRDPYGNAASGAGLTLMFATPAQGFTFHGANDCSSSPPALLGAVTSADFRFRGTAAGPAPITVSAGVLAPAMQTEVIDAGPAAAVAFTTLPRTQTAGACSMTPLAVQTQDGFGNPVPVAGNVSLASDGGFRFYPAMGCAMGTDVGQVPLSGSTASFFFEGTIAGTFDINAASGPLTKASQPQTIQPDVAARLRIVRPVPSAQVNVCSAGPVTVETRDAFGNLVTVPAGLTVSVDGGAAVTAYDAMGCGLAVPAVSVPPNGSEASFFFTASATGMQPVAVSAAGFTGDSALLNVTPGPTQLTLRNVPMTYYAGQCVQLAVRAEDSMGAPVAVGADTTVTLTPATGFTFYSDAACTASIPTVTIMNGQTTATFYLRAVTGGTFNVGASAPMLSAASAPLDVIPAVRRGTCGLGNGQTVTPPCPISPPLLATDRSFLIFQSEIQAGNSSSQESMLRCRITSTSNVECRRAGNQNRTVVAHWQIATLPTAVTVQHVSDGVCITNGATIPIGNTNVNQSFVLHSASSAGGNIDDNEHDTVELTSSTAVTPLHAGAACNTHDLQVVSFAGGSVTRGTAQLDAGTLALDVALPPAAQAGRAFLLYSWRTASVGPDACERNLRGSLDAGALTFTRGNGGAANPCADDAYMSVAYERVELPAGLVQSVDLAMPSGQTRGAASFATPVDPTRTLVFTGSNTWSGQGLGENDITSDDDPENFVGRFALDGGSEVLGARVQSTGDTRYHVFVVELDPR